MTYRNLLALFGDAHAVIDQTGIVAEQRIPAVLRDDTQRHQDSQPVTIPAGLHEVKIAAVLLVLHLQTNGVFDLAVFKLDCRVVLVPVAMVVSQDAECLIVSLLGHEPTRRLWDPLEFSAKISGK